MFVYRYVLLYRYERRGIIQEQAGVCSCASIYNLYILYVYMERASVIVCIITMTLPPTSEVYLSVVNGEKPHVGDSCMVSRMKLFQQARSAAAREMSGPSVNPCILQSAKEGRFEVPTAVCQLPLLERSRSLEPGAGRDHPCCEFQIWLFLLDGDRAHQNSVFEEDTDHQEHKVEAEHDEAQHFVHPPFAECNGEDDEEQHDEEEDDGTEEAIAADSHRLEPVNDGVQEPGQWEPVRGRRGRSQTC